MCMIVYSRVFRRAYAEGSVVQKNKFFMYNSKPNFASIVKILKKRKIVSVKVLKTKNETFKYLNKIISRRKIDKYPSEILSSILQVLF